MTLTAVASLTRKFIFIFVLLSILGIISIIGYRVWTINQLASLPPVEEKPDERWGTLPSPDFPTSDVTSSNFSYTLATPTGKLPEIGKITKVYFMPKSFSSLLASEKAQSLAKNFNLDSPPEIITETRYRFAKDGKSLVLDLESGNFTYQNSSISASTSTELKISDSEIIQNFKNLLTSLDLLKDELKNGTSKIRDRQVSLWPADIEQKPIVFNNFNESLINSLPTGTAQGLDSYQTINYTYWPVDTTSFSTYSTRSSTQAFEDLKKGKGIVVVNPKNPQVSITSVYLAFYQSQNYTPYLQPIFVFEGPDFVAIMPAIKEESLVNQPN